MKNIMKKDMIRKNADIYLCLGDEYNKLVEGLVFAIKEEVIMQTVDIKTAVELCMLDLEISNAPFYDILRPYYNENYDLIPLIGIDGLMDLAVKDALTKRVLEDDVLTAIGRLIAFDHMVENAKDTATYSGDMINFINDIIPTAYMDIQEMLEDVEVGLEITEIKSSAGCNRCENCSCKSQSPFSQQITVTVLNNDDLADDLLALLKLINGGK